MATDAAVQEREETVTTEQQNGETQLAPRADAPLSRTGAMGFGLVPSTIDEAWRLAGILAKSSMVPKSYAGKPEDMLVAFLYGNDLGLPPMAALQSVAVINGKPGVYGDGFLGVIQSKPAYAKHQEFYELSDGTRVRSLRKQDYDDDETKAVSMFWRKGNPDPFIQEFSIGSAKRARLWGKEGPWSNYPARQLMWRARSFAGRDAFAAELRGIKMAEELLDTPDDDTIVSVATIPEPVRRSEKVATAIAPTSDAGEEASSGTPAQAGDTEPAPQAAAVNGGAQKSAGGGKSSAAAKADRGPGQVTKNVRISETAFVAKPKTGGEPYWEIHGEVGEPGKPAVVHTWHTRDEEMSKLAESCAGTEALFDVTWHSVTSPSTTKAVKVITGLAAK